MLVAAPGVQADAVFWCHAPKHGVVACLGSGSRAGEVQHCRAPGVVAFAVVGTPAQKAAQVEAGAAAGCRALHLLSWEASW